jgi:hypothetical protein
MTDIGVSCAKGSYGRTAGKPMSCESGYENNAGLCYKPCGSGYTGVGPVCWSSSCPSGYDKCGSGLCLKRGISCSSTIATMAKSVVTLMDESMKAMESSGTGNEKKALTQAKQKGSMSGVFDATKGVIDAYSFDICGDY